MDFHGMKRKELQALCKKHNVPANLSNLDMANRLASILKESEKSSTDKGASCLKRKDEKIRANYSGIENREIKKPKLNSEDEIVELSSSDGGILKTGTRVRSVGEKSNQSVETVDKSESTKRNLGKAVRVRKPRVRKSEQGDLAMDLNTPTEKKRGRRAVKDVNTTTDKPGQLPSPPELPPPTEAKSSDSKEPRLPKRRSLRKSPNPSVGKKRERKSANDVSTHDKPPLPPPMPQPQPQPQPPNVAESSGNAADQELGLPRRGSTRKISNPCVGKKRDKKSTKDVGKSDKPPPMPLPPSVAELSGVTADEDKSDKPPAMPLPQPPSVAELSGVTANEEPGLPKRRSMRKNEVVKGSEKQERKVAGDVNSSDKPPQQPHIPPLSPHTVVEFSNNKPEGPRVPKRRSTRKRGMVEGGEFQILSDKPSPRPPMPPPTVAKQTSNATNQESRKQKCRSVRNKGLGEGSDVELPNASLDEMRVKNAAKNGNARDNAAAKEIQIPKRRLLRKGKVENSENINSPLPSKSTSKVRKPLQPLPTNVRFSTPNSVAMKNVKVTSRRLLKNKENGAVDTMISENNAREITGRRLLKNKENVADTVILTNNASKIIPKKRKKETTEAANETVPLEKVLKQKEANTAGTCPLKEELGKNERVKRQKITRSKTQLTVNASTIDGGKEVFQLEEPSQHQRINQNKRKCNEMEEVEKPLKGYIRNCRETDRALHFTNRAGDVVSSDLTDSVNIVGQARGGVVFWCNGSGWFPLPKW